MKQTYRDIVYTILRQCAFRSSAADQIMAHSTFAIRDLNSAAGGGTVLPAGRQRWDVKLDSVQHEACVHECAHVWWFLNQDDESTKTLITQVEMQADLAHLPGYERVRNLCKTYIYGDGSGFPGMWVGEPYNRWNADEIFAGLASGTMGDLSLFPPGLQAIYGGMLRRNEQIWLPTLFGAGVKSYV